MIIEMKHRHQNKFQTRVAFAYMIIILFTYIYVQYIVENYGDILTESVSYDILGEYKCVPKFEGCEDQYIDGWSIARIIVFIMVGIANPHSHYNMLGVAVFAQLYSYINNNTSRHIMNPVLTMLGYSIGSFMCPGNCFPSENNKKD